ncbi:MAG TPA: ribulose-phosphate 3-epimerase [Candidatus Polarisedimenticolia bacterium]|nr:ribulose-phosphate 3-epimerase [Candidatus Polarisedimenticolia bacterium]
MPALAPSILTADFGHLADEIAAAEAGGAGLFHLDVMDGHFVPNLTIGPLVVEAIDRMTDRPLDVHLMIERPDAYIERFARAGADMISVHQEAVPHLHRTVQLIRDCGAAPGVALNPATPIDLLEDILSDVDYVLLMSVNPGFGGQRFIPSVMAKVGALRERLDASGCRARIEVDGGVGPDNIVALREQGADILVAGSAVFDGRDPKGRARALADLLERARRR